MPTQLPGYLFKGIILGIFLFLILVISLVLYMTWMPSQSSNGNPGPDTETLAIIKSNLTRHVNNIANSPFGRNIVNEDTLSPARDYISEQFNHLSFTPNYHTYKLYGDTFTNIIVDIPGQSQQQNILIIAAHYDSVENSPGANDNASGVAALIEIGRYLKANPPARPVRLIAFANEEPPYFQTSEMGSFVYAKNLANKNEKIVGMISLESIGYYTNQKGTQRYPGFLGYLYPDRGNFVAFIGNLQSRALLTRSLSLFRKNSHIPSEGLASPGIIPGVAWSDHWSFWQSGYKAIMVTDTAPYRYSHYHKKTDTPDKLDYATFSKVVYGLCRVITGLTNK